MPQDLTVGGGNLKIHVAAAGHPRRERRRAMQNIVVQDLPDIGPWTATTRMTWNPTANFQNAGLKVYDSDDNWIKFGMVCNAGRKFEAYKELDDGPTSLDATATLPAEFPSTFYLRLVSDGMSIAAQYSADGLSGPTWAPRPT